MKKTIKLYHGTIHEFDAIDVAKGKPYKDFGAGFYLSPSEQHSANLAIRNKEIELIRAKQHPQKAEVCAWIYTYEFDLEHLNSLNVKNFPNANGEWMRFVVSNRNNRERQHNFDIVTGPTANDNTRASIQAFFAGVYGDISSANAVNILISVLEPHKLPIQYFFGSQKAADLLVFKNKAAIK
jgi:hypothetical protein